MGKSILHLGLCILLVLIVIGGCIRYNPQSTDEAEPSESIDSGKTYKICDYEKYESVSYIPVNNGDEIDEYIVTNRDFWRWDCDSQTGRPVQDDTLGILQNIRVEDSPSVYSWRTMADEKGLLCENGMLYRLTAKVSSSGDQFDENDFCSVGFASNSQTSFVKKNYGDEAFSCKNLKLDVIFCPSFDLNEKEQSMQLCFDSSAPALNQKIELLDAQLTAIPVSDYPLMNCIQCYDLTEKDLYEKGCHTEIQNTSCVYQKDQGIRIDASKEGHFSWYLDSTESNKLSDTFSMRPGYIYQVLCRVKVLQNQESVHSMKLGVKQQAPTGNPEHGSCRTQVVEYESCVQNAGALRTDSEKAIDLSLWLSSPDEGIKKNFSPVFEIDFQDKGSVLIQKIEINRYSLPHQKKYNSSAHTLYVDGNASDKGDGTAAAPYQTLDQAFSFLRKVYYKQFRILVAGDCVYHPEGLIPDYSGILELIPNVSIFGGYESKSWYRDPARYRSIICSDIKMAAGSRLNGFILSGQMDMEMVNPESKKCDESTIANCVFFNLERKNAQVALTCNPNNCLKIVNNVFVNYPVSIRIEDNASAEILNNHFVSTDESIGISAGLVSPASCVNIQNNVFENIQRSVVLDCDNRTNSFPDLLEHVKVQYNQVFGRNETDRFVCLRGRSNPDVCTQYQLGNHNDNENNGQWINPCNILCDFQMSSSSLSFNKKYKTCYSSFCQGCESDQQKDKLCISDFDASQCEEVRFHEMLDLVQSIDYALFLPDDSSVDFIINAGNPSSDYSDYFNREGIGNGSRNDAGITGGPFSYFSTNSDDGNNIELRDIYQIPRAWNVHYDQKGKTRTVTFEDSPDLIAQKPWHKRLQGYAIIRGPEEQPGKMPWLKDYARHDIHWDGSRLFPNDSWGTGTVIGYIPFDPKNSKQAESYHWVDRGIDMKEGLKADKNYSYIVMAMYLSYNPAFNYQYSYWNTQSQLLLKNTTISPGGELILMDPGKTYDFRNLKNGLVFSLLNDSIELKLNYPKTVMKNEKSRELIHVFNPEKFYECSVIIGEYLPELTDVDLSYWQLADMCNNRFMGRISENSPTPSILSLMDLQVEMSCPNIRIGWMYEGFITEYPPMGTFMFEGFTPASFEESTFYYLRYDMKLESDDYDYSDFPETIEITLVSVDENNDPIKHSNEKLVKRTLLLAKQTEKTKGVIRYLSEDYHLLFFDYKEDGNYEKEYYGEPSKDSAAPYFVQMVVKNGIALEMGEINLGVSMEKICDERIEK